MVGDVGFEKNEIHVFNVFIIRQNVQYTVCGFLGVN